jgi:thioredoxin-like negative regulator of GroEL
MTGIALAAVLQVALAVSDTPYQQALRKSSESGRPVLVLISASWCGPCQMVKHHVLPVLKERGWLDKVEFVLLDYDQDRRDVAHVMTGRTVPELNIVWRTPQGWRRDTLSGGHRLQNVEHFIKTHLAEPATYEVKTTHSTAALADKK